MAYFIMDSTRAAYDNNGPKNVVVIQVDSSSDLPNPVPEDWAPGSAAWDTSTGDIYGLNSEKRWENQGSGGTIPMLIEKTITENGTYNASDDSADGYSKVTVEVSSAPTPETFDVEITIDYGTNSYTCNKTYTEINSAYEAGKNVICTVTWQEGGEATTLQSYGVTKQELPVSESETIHYITFALTQIIYAQGPAFPSFAISDFNGTGLLSIKEVKTLSQN